MVVQFDTVVKRKLLKAFEPGRRRIEGRASSHMSMIPMSYLPKYRPRLGHS